HPNVGSSIPLSTIQHRGGEYVALVGVGSSLHTMHMLVDTGSAFIWWQCSTCIDCYPQRDILFNPAESSSYQDIMCNSDQCGDHVSGSVALHCDKVTNSCRAYEYVSVVKGYLASETIT
ncbi:Asp domain-containing protein, partial [Cephalotus follicularis]